MSIRNEQEKLECTRIINYLLKYLLPINLLQYCRIFVCYFLIRQHLNLRYYNHPSDLKVIIDLRSVSMCQFSFFCQLSTCQLQSLGSICYVSTEAGCLFVNLKDVKFD